MPSLNALLTALLDPTPTALVLALGTVLLVPLLLHFLIYRSRAGTVAQPTFLLLGPSGAGKTALATSFSSTTPPETRVSQSPLSLPCSIPASLADSAKYRSANDPDGSGKLRFLLHDTPGHGKLRARAVEQLGKVRGVVFVVDASAGEWRDAGEYLYNVLLGIQKSEKKKGPFPVLVACTKADLFTALPPAKIRRVLEEELGKVRESRSRGVVGVGEEDREDEEEWLGSGGREEFTFEELEEEAGIEVEFRGGSTVGDGWRKPLGEWIGKWL